MWTYCKPLYVNLVCRLDVGDYPRRQTVSTYMVAKLSCTISRVHWHQDRLVGLVVKASAFRAEDREFDSRRGVGIFLGQVIPVS